MAAATTPSTNKSAIVCRLVNRHKANVVLPAFYASPEDKADKRNPRKVRLGTELDMGVVGAASPEVSLNAYERDQLAQHPAIRGMIKKRWLEFQGPSLNIV